MDWFRLHHGTCTDPKWRIVCKRSGQPAAIVIAVWLAMLERASQSTPRGSIAGWSDDDMALILDIDSTQVLAVREAMQGKTLEGDAVVNWDRRQPKREDGSAERAKAWRERNRTQPNATERTANAIDRTRTPDREIEREKENITEAKASGASAPRNSFEKDYFDKGKKVLGSKAGGVLASLLKAKGSAEQAYAVLLAAEDAQNPMEYVQGAIREKPKPEPKPARKHDPQYDDLWAEQTRLVMEKYAAREAAKNGHA